MIKFFRNIRRTLLGEGQTGNYLKYALGEIALVVIGILIALSINNWNENRKNIELEKAYITRLANEMAEEYIYYEGLERGFGNQLKAIDRMMGRWESPDEVIQDSSQFKKDLMSVAASNPWYKEPVTWIQLVQSGEMKLIRNQKLLDDLFQYYSEVKSAAANFEQYPTQTINEARKRIASIFVNDSAIIEFRNPDKLLKPETVLYVMSHPDDLKELFVRMGLITRIQRASMEKLKNSAKKNLQFLESYNKQM